MNESQVRQVFLDHLGLRIGPETAGYVRRRCEAMAAAGVVPVIAADARTGVPVARDVPLDALADPSAAGADVRRS